MMHTHILYAYYHIFLHNQPRADAHCEEKRTQTEKEKKKRFEQKNLAEAEVHYTDR